MVNDRTYNFLVSIGICFAVGVVAVCVAGVLDKLAWQEAPVEHYEQLYEWVEKYGENEEFNKMVWSYFHRGVLSNKEYNQAKKWVKKHEIKLNAIRIVDKLSEQKKRDGNTRYN